jgi:hypothetical protein
MKEERRDDTRHEVTFPVRMITSQGDVIRGETGNVSVQGVFIRSPLPLAPRERFFLEIDFPSGRTFRGPASVVWVRSSTSDEVGEFRCGMGVRLELLNARLNGSPTE